MAITNAPACCSRQRPASGALDGFIAEVIEDHIREHMLEPNAKRDDPRTVAAEELVEIVHAYLKK